MYKKYRARELSERDVELALEGFNETCAGISVETKGQAVSHEAIILLNQYGSTHFQCDQIYNQPQDRFNRRSTHAFRDWLEKRPNNISSNLPTTKREV